jgi:hypothetical protein
VVVIPGVQLQLKRQARAPKLQVCLFGGKTVERIVGALDRNKFTRHVRGDYTCTRMCRPKGSVEARIVHFQRYQNCSFRNRALSILPLLADAPLETSLV